MSANAAPVWVTVAIAFGAALISAAAAIFVVRSSNKGQRSAQEDRLRREQEQALEMFWIRERRDTYARMLEAWTFLIGELIELATRVDHGTTSTSQLPGDPLSTWRTYFRQAVIVSNEAEMLAGAAVKSAIAQVMTEYKRIDAAYETAPAGKAADAVKRAADGGWTDAIDGLRNACRSELTSASSLPTHPQLGPDPGGQPVDDIVGLFGKDARTDVVTQLAGKMRVYRIDLPYILDKRVDGDEFIPDPNPVDRPPDEQPDGGPTTVTHE